jgi:hypothetical protein
MPALCCKEFWSRIADDEPIFILAARDKTAPARVNDWIETCRTLGVNQDKLERAKNHLTAMIEWQAANPDKVKLPD